MSIFKDTAIVLKMQKQGDKDMIYTLFSFEYGKIRAIKKYSKKEKSIDLGNIINFEIHTKEGITIHKISNLKIHSEFDTLGNNSFSITFAYLEILAKIFANLPDGLANKEVFCLIQEINQHKNITKLKLTLAGLKLQSLLGELELENKNPQISKILKFVNVSKLKDIFRLTGIGEELERELNKVNQ